MNDEIIEENDDAEESSQTITVAVLSVIFLFIITAFIFHANNLLYMRAEMTILLVISVIPLLIVFFFLRWKKTKVIAKRFLLTSFSIMVSLLIVSTIMETTNTLPVAKIVNDFKAPSGWIEVKDGNVVKLSPGQGLLPCLELMGDKCPYANKTWKTMTTNPKTLNDLIKVAKANGYSDFTITNNGSNFGNNSSVYNPELRLMNKEKKVTLSLYNSEYNENYWELRLKVR